MGKASLDLDYKIEILGEGARFDLCGSCGGGIKAPSSGRLDLSG